MRFDEDQDRALATALERGATLVAGAPGTGKTTVLLAAAMAEAAAGVPVVYLAATRQAADVARDRVVTEHGSLPLSLSIKTAQAWAFTILSEYAADRGRGTPELITGPTQDALLADIIDDLGEEAGWPAEITAETTRLPGFRAELRDLLTRAHEFGLPPQFLIGSDDPMWQAAGRVMRTYEEMLALEDATVSSAPDRLDHASLVHLAAKVIERDDMWSSSQVIPRPGFVVVDDYENATLATAHLVAAASRTGARVCLAADPDVAVQSFRGGLSILPSLALEPSGLNATLVTLTQRHRGGETLGSAHDRLVSRIGTAGIATHRVPAHAPGQDSLDLVCLPGVDQERFHIIRLLSLAHRRDNIDFNDMAILTRSRAEHAELERVLTDARIPVRPAPRTLPLRYSPVVSALMSLIALGLGEEDEALYRDVLASPLLDVSPDKQRHLRLGIAAHASRDTDNPYRDLVAAPPTDSWAAPLAELGDLIDAVRKAIAEGMDAEQVLWVAWNRAGRARTWQDQALTGTVLAKAASQLLDDVMAMFRYAQRLVDRDPRTTPATLVDELRSQDLVEDTIARAGHASGVHLMTPAMGIGREFSLVIVSGVNEGIWPNTRVRDGIFGATRLADMQLGSLVEGQSAVRSVVADELRMLAFAISRARTKVVVTAIEADDTSPSRFLDILGQPTALTATPVALTEAGIVGQLRSMVSDPHLRVSADDRVWARRALATLAERGVRGAAPAEWLSLLEASGSGPWAPQPRISPSGVEGMLTCPLKWFLSRAGLEYRDSTMAADIGTLMHSLAERVPDGNRVAMEEILDEELPTLLSTVNAGHEAAEVRERVEEMVGTLSAYLSSAPQPDQVEVSLRSSYRGARVSGRIDRIEDGVVVDFKTSKHAMSHNDAASDPQMRTYQWLLRETGNEPAGARLVYLGKPTAKGLPTERSQPPLGPEDVAELEAQFDAILTNMGAEDVAAIPSQQCRTCPSKHICPIFTESLFS